MAIRRLMPPDGRALALEDRRLYSNSSSSPFQIRIFRHTCWLSRSISNSWLFSSHYRTVNSLPLKPCPPISNNVLQSKSRRKSRRKSQAAERENPTPILWPQGRFRTPPLLAGGRGIFRVSTATIVIRRSIRIVVIIAPCPRKHQPHLLHKPIKNLKHLYRRRQAGK